MDRARVTAALETIIEHAPSLLDSAFQRPRCVASTKLVTSTLRHLNITAEPLAVCLQAFTPEFVRRRIAGMEMTAENSQEWLDAGAKYVQVGYNGFTVSPSERMPIDLHLVSIVDDTFLVDLEAPDVSRPAMRMTVLKPFMFDVDADFLCGNKPLVNNINLGEGEFQIAYLAHPSDKQYVNGPNWSDRKRTRPLVNQLAALVREVWKG